MEKLLKSYISSGPSSIVRSYFIITYEEIKEILQHSAFNINLINIDATINKLEDIILSNLNELIKIYKSLDAEIILDDEDFTIITRDIIVQFLYSFLNGKVDYSYSSAINNDDNSISEIALILSPILLRCINQYK